MNPGLKRQRSRTSDGTPQVVDCGGARRNQYRAAENGPVGRQIAPSPTSPASQRLIVSPNLADGSKTRGDASVNASAVLAVPSSLLVCLLGKVWSAGRDVAVLRGWCAWQERASRFSLLAGTVASSLPARFLL